MNKVNCADLLPKEPPAGMISWLREEKGELLERMLVYKEEWVKDPLTGINQRMCKVTCTDCGDDYFTTKTSIQKVGAVSFGFWDNNRNIAVEPGDECTCELCGAKAQAEHASQLKKGKPQNVWAMSLHKVNGKVALCGWMIQQTFWPSGERCIQAFPYEAYVVEGKKIIRLTGWHGTMRGSKSFFGHWEQRVKYCDGWGEAPYVYPWEASLLENTELENSKLDIFLSCCQNPRPLAYIKLWQKHPNIENLVMQGAGALLAEKINKEQDFYGYISTKATAAPRIQLNWSESRPAQMLGMEKHEFRKCVAEGWTVDELDVYKMARNKGEMLSSDDMRLVSMFGVIDCRCLLNHGHRLIHTIRYIKKQHDRHAACDLRYLMDYWDMSSRLGYDMRDIHNAYPKDLHQAHTRMIQERREREDKAIRKDKEARKELFLKRQKELNSFAWAWGDLIIVPAQSEAELELEGKKLSHCVGCYADRMAKGKTAIFFIRRADSPSKPFFTLQLDEKTLVVRQNRGKCNCRKTPEVEQFEKAWIQHLKEMRAGRGKRTSKSSKGVVA